MEEIKQMVETQIQNQSEMVENQTSPQQEAVVAAKEQIKQDNLVAMRKKMEEAERRAEQAERRAQQVEQERHPGQPEQVQEEEYYGDPEDYVANKHLQKTTKKFTTKLTESDKKLQALEQKLAYFEAKTELDSIKDFNEVVTDENLKTFARLYPDDYETVMSNPNLKSKSKTAYNMIKNYGIANVSPLLKQQEKIAVNDKKIEANRLKPGYAAGAPISSSPLTNASLYNEDGRLRMSDDEAKRVYKEMRVKMGIR